MPQVPTLEEIRKLSDQAYWKTPPAAPYGILYENPPCLMSTKTFIWFDDLTQVVEFLKKNALFELSRDGEWDDRDQIRKIKTAVTGVITGGLSKKTLGPLDRPHSSMEIVWCGSFDDLCSGEDLVSKKIIQEYEDYKLQLLDDKSEVAKRISPSGHFSLMTANNINEFAEFICNWNERNT